MTASRVTRIEKVSIFWLLFKVQSEFLCEIISTQSGDVFGYFCLYLICLHLYLNKQFQSAVFRRYFKSSEGVWCRCLVLSYWWRNFCIFWFGYCFGYFFPKFELIFYQSSGHPASLEPWWRYFGILWFGNCFGYFFPKFGLIFYQSYGHPVSLDKRLKLIAQNCYLRSNRFYRIETWHQNFWRLNAAK